MGRAHDDRCRWPIDDPARGVDHCATPRLRRQCHLCSGRNSGRRSLRRAARGAQHHASGCIERHGRVRAEPCRAVGALLDAARCAGRSRPERPVRTANGDVDDRASERSACHAARQLEGHAADGVVTGSAQRADIDVVGRLDRGRGLAAAHDADRGAFDHISRGVERGTSGRDDLGSAGLAFDDSAVRAQSHAAHWAQGDGRRGAQHDPNFVAQHHTSGRAFRPGTDGAEPERLECVEQRAARRAQLHPGARAEQHRRRSAHSVAARRAQLDPALCAERPGRGWPR